MTGTKMTTVAAFDVDGTVTDRDCVVPFLRRVAGTATLGRRLVAQTRTVSALASRRDRDGLRKVRAEMRGLHGCA